MKRLLCYIAIIGLVIAAPAKPLNIGKLLPVRAVGVYKEGSWYRIETDTGNRGYGGTVSQALRNLKDTASGTIYLDTANYLLLTAATEAAVGELAGQLRPSVKLCLVTKPIDLVQAADYLDVHRGLPELSKYKSGAELPVISPFGEMITFLKKVEKRA